MHCVVPENVHTPPWRELEILEGRGAREGTKLQSLYRRKMEVPEGRGVNLQIPSLVGYGYFLELHIGH